MPQTSISVLSSGAIPCCTISRNPKSFRSRGFDFWLWPSSASQGRFEHPQPRSLETVLLSILARRCPPGPSARTLRCGNLVKPKTREDANTGRKQSLSKRSSSFLAYYCVSSKDLRGYCAWRAERSLCCQVKLPLSQVL